MIIEETKLAPILDENGVYQCQLIKQLFAYSLLNKDISPLGNVICFESPVRLGPLIFNNALVLAAELPNVNAFGAVCFQRLYLSQLGTLLSVFTGEESWLDESSIFASNKQASVKIANQIKDSNVFNIIFPLDITNKELDFFELKLEDDKKEEFKQNAIDSFYFLLHNIFIETRRDNF